MKKIRGYYILAALCLAAALTGCADTPEESRASRTAAAESRNEMEIMDIEILENRENELVFSISIDDFIDGYNSGAGHEYLTESARWMRRTYDSAIHSDHETTLYTFSENEKVWSLPTITVYVPTNGDHIQQVTVNFDEHSRTEELYGLYEEMCFHTVKTFLPELSDGQIRELCATLNQQACDNVFSNEEGYRRGSVPSVLYYKDGVGLYPYFAIGEWLHLCVIPVTAETIGEFERKGVEVHEIRTDDPGEETAARIEAECLEIAKVCKDAFLRGEKIPADFPEGSYILSQDGFDRVEACLIDAGYPTLDTQGDHPAYLANPEAVYDFWESVQKGETAEMRYLRVRESGGFSCIMFSFDGSGGKYYAADVEFDGDASSYISRLESREVLDWELTEKGNFYYQVLPSDLHYVDYQMLRLVPPDRELYDLALKYILPVGYQATNLFLCDWSETDFGDLSFNDVFEFLYLTDEEAKLDLEEFSQHEDPFYYQIPADLFEETVLPCFAISRQALREKGMYDGGTHSYPWLPQGTNEFFYFPFLEAEVTGYRENADGTLTLTVNVSSPELKTDDLFGHEVTVRPGADGGFQYVSNRILYQTEYGLPPCEPRLTAEGYRGGN